MLKLKQQQQNPTNTGARILKCTYDVLANNLFVSRTYLDARLQISIHFLNLKKKIIRLQIL